MTGPYRDLEAGLYDLEALVREHPGCYIEISKKRGIVYGGAIAGGGIVTDVQSITLRWSEDG